MYWYTVQLDSCKYLVMDIPIRGTIRPCIEKFRKADKAATGYNGAFELQRHDGIILRPPPGHPVENFPEFLSGLIDEKNDWNRRISTKPVHILFSSNFQPQISSNVNPQAITGAVTPDLPFIQQAEFNTLIERGRAILPELVNASYRTPSRRNAKAFLRAGNAQTSRAALDGIFFWLLPHLADIDGVLSDTWSIGSTALNISRRLATYTGQKPLPIEFLSPQQAPVAGRYDNLNSDLDRLISKIKPPSHRKVRLLALTSVISSGTLVNKIREVSRNFAQVDIKPCALFDVGGQVIEGLPVVHRLQNHELFGPSENPVTLEIDSKTFFVTAQIDEAVKIGSPFHYKEEIPRSFVDFLKDYLTVPDLFRLHTTERASNLKPRHHCIFINAEKLVETPKFEERFKSHLDKIENDRLSSKTPTVVLAKDTAANRRLREYTKTKWPGATFYEAHYSLQSCTDLFTHVKTLSEQDHIIILDDVFTVDEVPSRFAQQLREHVRCSVTYLVALARPETVSAWRVMEEQFTCRFRLEQSSSLYPNAAMYVEFLLLPNWGVEDCPWCNEQRHLGQFLEECSDCDKEIGFT